MERKVRQIPTFVILTTLGGNRLWVPLNYYLIKKTLSLRKRFLDLSRKVHKEKLHEVCLLGVYSSLSEKKFQSALPLGNFEELTFRRCSNVFKGKLMSFQG